MPEQQRGERRDRADRSSRHKRCVVSGQLAEHVRASTAVSDRHCVRQRHEASDAHSAAELASRVLQPGRQTGFGVGNTGKNRVRRRHDHQTESATDKK